MKRVNFHLTDRQISALHTLSGSTGLSAAELIRRAVDTMLLQQQSALTPAVWSMGGRNSHGKAKTARKERLRV